MSDLSTYMLRQQQTRAARYEREAASARLQLARVMERLAEIRSQHEPLAELSGHDDEVRAKCLAAAFYVAVGRMPTE